MKTRALCLLFALGLCSHVAQAQWVTIPQPFATYIATYITASAISGSRLDTTNNAIITLQNLTICDLTVTDITGIKYFKGLQNLAVGSNGNCWSNVTFLPVLPPGLKYLETECHNLNGTISGFPDSLKTLKLYNTCVSNLPQFPATLQKIIATNSCYTTFPAFPLGLDTLILDGDSNLVTIPTPLPDSLKYLSANHCNINTLPLTPDGVIYIDVSYNPNLTSLSGFSSGVTEILANNCNLNSVPNLPLGVIYLNIYNNPNLASLTNLPQGLIQLEAQSTALTTIPSPVPNTMRRLNLDRSSLTTLPHVPDTMWLFNISHTPVSSLANLPSNSGVLIIDSLYRLTALPNYPKSFCTIYASYDPQLDIQGLLNNITAFCFGAPDTIDNNYDTRYDGYAQGNGSGGYLYGLTIDVSHDDLVAFPIPERLFNAYDAGIGGEYGTLDASYNSISNLQGGYEFAIGFTYINLSHNQISSYVLTNPTYYGYNSYGLYYGYSGTAREKLDLSYNNLNSINGIPYNPSVDFSHNQITTVNSLENIAGGLMDLNISNNPIQCLPFIPNYIVTLNTASTQLNCFPNNNNYTCTDNSGYTHPINYNTPICSLGNTNNCMPTGIITGTVFNDLNHNGVQDAGEAGVHNWNVAVNTAGITMETSTDVNGHYSLNCGLNQTSTVSDYTSSHVTYTTPTSINLNLTNAWQVDSLVNFGIIQNPPVPTPPDTALQLHLSALTDSKPGFDHYYQIDVVNPGTVPQSGHVVMYFDTALFYQASSPAGTVHGDSITWSFSNLAPFNRIGYSVHFIIPATVGLGTAIPAGAHAYCAYPSLTPSDTITQIAIGSYDPNEKVVSPATLNQQQIDTLAPLTYTVRFQNTGTASAINVYVQDTLSPYLDLSTFKFLASSSPAYWVIENRILTVNFYNISLPDSSASQSNSKAFFSYSVRPNAGHTASQVITNTAYITFDFNTAVATNTSALLPTATITTSQPLVICSGQSLPLQAPVLTNFSYQWFNNGLPITNATNSVYNATDSGSYTVQLSYGNVSTLSAPVLVANHVKPTPTLTTPTNTLCRNAQPVTLSVSPPGGILSGGGISGNSFNPATAIIGNNTINYLYTDSNGCDSTVSINVLVNPVPTSNIHQAICSGQSFLGYSTTGIFRDTFNAANSCDSIRTLNLVVNPVINTTVARTICQGQSYIGYNSTGVFKDTFNAANGCDSIRTLNLTVNPVYFDSIAQTICQGQTYLGYNTTGIFNDTFNAANGCDSIRTLNLTVNPRYFNNISQTICQGQTYLGYSATGTFIDIFIAANGCDSIRTLSLTVNATINTTDNRSICSGQTYLGYSASGTFIDTFNVANGCDSIRTLNLVVTPIIDTVIKTTICQGQSIGGHIVTGNYVDTFTAIGGCDSIRTLQLTVNPSPATTVRHTMCQGLTFEGYTTTGTFVDTFNAANSCDSIRTLYLTVNPLPRVSLVVHNTTLCRDAQPEAISGRPAGGTYRGSGIAGTVFDPGQAAIGVDTLFYAYTDTNGCSNTAYVTITINPLPTASLQADTNTVCKNGPPVALNGVPPGGLLLGSGIAAASFNPTIAPVGIDTIYYLYTDGNGCSTKVSATIAVQVCTGISAVSGIKFTVYPNPASNELNIVTYNDITGFTIHILDMAGKLALSQILPNPTANSISVSSLVNGAYLYQIIDKDNHLAFHGKVEMMK